VRFRGEAGTTVTGPWQATRTTALLWGQVDLDRSRRGGKGEPGKGELCASLTFTGEPKLEWWDRAREKGTAPPHLEPREEGDLIHPRPPSSH
jgi:hypothetical protein